jgi:predicted RNA-binding Zn-ribbon protein involved in translation (DUF1610 family)
MKNTNQCPKCGSKRVVMVPSDYSVAFPSRIRLGIFKCTAVHRYVCTDCGYVENWILGSENMQKVRERYT